jgi:uncharacterized membrane protein
MAFSLFVMARLVRATERGSVLEQVARTSRAMTMRERRFVQNLLWLPVILIAMGCVPVIFAPPL